MKQRAIIVDWALYCANGHAQEFVKAREGQARMILLVSDPESNDYVHPADSHPTENTPDGIEWDAVIRNTGKLSDVVFKMNALDIILNVSNLDPVVALDSNSSINRSYRASGVLITTEDM